MCDWVTVYLKCPVCQKEKSVMKEQNRSDDGHALVHVSYACGAIAKWFINDSPDAEKDPVGNVAFFHDMIEPCTEMRFEPWPIEYAGKTNHYRGIYGGAIGFEPDALRVLVGEGQDSTGSCRFEELAGFVDRVRAGTLPHGKNYKRELHREQDDSPSP